MPNWKKYHREDTNIFMVFRKEYRTKLAFKMKNVGFKSIEVKILQFMCHSKIEIWLIDFQNRSVELKCFY
jgi:hypothetical protein